MPIESFVPRAGTTSMSAQLVERVADLGGVFELAIADAFQASGMEEGTPYYIRLQVVELLPSGDD